MSYKATAWAYDLPLKGPAKMVLVALADFADEAGSCYPGQDKLALMTGLSRATVQRALQRLESMALLSREHRYDRRGYRTSDRFVLSLDTQVLSITAPTGQSAYKAERADLSITLHTPKYQSEAVTISRTTRENHQGRESTPTPETVDNPEPTADVFSGPGALVPWCKRHAANEGTDRPCASCARAKTLWSAQVVAESRTNVWQATGRKSKLDPTTHCEHGQFIGKCETCAYEERKAAEIITAQFGERA